jgi:hypothetical protein
MITKNKQIIDRGDPVHFSFGIFLAAAVAVTFLFYFEVILDVFANSPLENITDDSVKGEIFPLGNIDQFLLLVTVDG